MKHCIILLAHKGFNQLKLVIDLADYADFYIHIDKKSEILYNKVYNYIASENRKNIFLIKKREDVNWSAFSQVKATLNMIEEVVDSKIQYDYVHFISGQDLPIKSMEEIEEIIYSYKTDLIQNPNFINYYEIGNYKWRLKIYSFFRENKYNRTLLFKILDNVIRKLQIHIFRIERNNLKGMKLYVGSSWWSLTFDCVQYINQFINNSNIIDDYRFTCCPDEHFFQIIVMNSKFKNSVVNNNLRYVEFKPGNSSPNYILEKDVEKVLQSKNIFGRKFDEDIDALSIEKIKKTKK